MPLPSNDTIPALTAIADTAADTTAMCIDSIPPQWFELWREQARADSIAALPVPPPWQSGIDGDSRSVNAGDNSGVLTVVAAIFLLMMFGYRGCKHLFSTLYHDMLGMRRRANAFDEHTANETRLLTLMAVQWSVYTGLLLYSFVSLVHPLDTSRAFTHVIQFVGLTAAYYLVQLCAYWVVGFTFTSAIGCKLFIKGFMASQSLLGFFLIIPALVAIFYPDGALAMTITGAALYLTARIIFLIKGFRIFYHKIYSLLYFILYLCTLEIIPLIYIYKIALSIH